ncbi:MAG: hypothetical protein A3I66_00800 [Burkholderiales bacterium RIFCSPLOWO2_02_FULL_57_36]|nr:MAG: hypothetical protein A3I66_00800 [Burkholderiales bacterium RIFCSPLOWO2_02_FULL_57_36]
MNGAAKIDRRDVDELLAAVQAAFKSLREGVATMHQWSILAGSLDVAKAIERQGVVRGLHEHLASADTALQSIYKRARKVDGWKPTALHFHELDAVREFVNLHAFQIRKLSRAEFDQVVNAAAGMIRSNGGRASVIRMVSGAAA